MWAICATHRAASPIVAPAPLQALSLQTIDATALIVPLAAISGCP